MIFVTLAKWKDKHPEDDAEASKHVGVLAIYKILLICIHIVHLLSWIIKKKRDNMYAQII
jgi:hypothetical protein